MPSFQLWYPVSLFILGALSSTLGVTATAILPPTGPYNFGVKKLEILYVNDGDPIAPSNVTNSFLATNFYPTHEAPKSPSEQ
jgi:hypothetical protein